MSPSVRRCPSCGGVVPEVALVPAEDRQPRTWRACPRCGSLGRLRDYKLAKVPPDRHLPVEWAVLIETR